MTEPRRITINIAGRTYPLSVMPQEEETLRRVGKQIEGMIKDFEASFEIRDKQDALAMCALRLGTKAENAAVQMEKITNASVEKVQMLSRLLEGAGD